MGHGNCYRSRFGSKPSTWAILPAAIAWFEAMPFTVEVRPVAWSKAITLVLIILTLAPATPLTVVLRLLPAEVLETVLMITSALAIPLTVEVRVFTPLLTSVLVVLAVRKAAGDWKTGTPPAL